MNAQHPQGPGEPFTLLFDSDAFDSDDPRANASLPEPFRAFYGGDWRVPEAGTRPYSYANFAVSRDGRVSFNEPGHLGGGDVSGFNAHDRWLMALLRARADAVMVGDNTLRLEPGHLWTSSYIHPEDAPAFTALRRAEGRAPYPLQVFLSLTGELDAGAAVFGQEELHVIVATTTRGAKRASSLRCAARLEVLALGDDACDLERLTHILRADYGVKTLLCEGGPRVYGAMLAKRLVTDEFLTLCPAIIGNRQGEKVRPGLVEGVAFGPQGAPRSKLLSLRRAGDHLFLRSRYDALKATGV